MKVAWTYNNGAKRVIADPAVQGRQLTSGREPDIDRIVWPASRDIPLVMSLMVL